MKQRYAAAVEYHGAAYNGWQRQPSAQGVGVQSIVEAALGHVANHRVSTICAGRTDSGVHAVGQIIHFDSAATRTVDQWRDGANSHLPPDVQLQWLTPVEADFDARFSAHARSYRYLIYNQRIPSALLHNLCTAWRTPLDHVRMQQAATLLLGEHDFSSFRASGCGANTPVRNVEQIDIQRHDQWVVIDIKANAFLLHMVRNIVGALIEIGENKRDRAWLEGVLDARDRSAAARTAPAAGLYFVKAYYNAALPSTAGAPRYW